MRRIAQPFGFLALLTGALVVFRAAAAQVYASEEEAAYHMRTLAMFENICLQTLPGFEAAEERFAASGLSGEPQGFWSNDSKGLIARTTRNEDDRQRGCFLALADANLRALDAELGDLLGASLRLPEVGVLRGPRPNDPSLYLVDRDGYRITAVVAEVSQGYAMLSVSVDVSEGATPPWGAE
mgnify:CR=1 FL=1